MTTPDSIHDIVCQVIAEVIVDGGRQVDSIDGKHNLREDLQLDSLDLAVIVVRLAEKLGVDPFRQRRRPVRIVADFVDAYVEALSSTP